MSSFETSPISGSLTLRLTPRGHLLLVPDADVSALAADIQQQLVDAFAVGGGSGLFYLGSTQVGTVLPSVLAWWRELCRALCDSRVRRGGGRR